MLRLKEVVDKQRDELRAQAHEIVCKSRDTEAVSVWELAVGEGPWGPAFMSPRPGAVTAGDPAGADAFPVALPALMSLGGGPELLLCLTLGCPGPSSCRSNCIASWP